MQRCEMDLNNLACDALVIDNNIYINKEIAPMCVSHHYAIFHVLGILGLFGNHSLIPSPYFHFSQKKSTSKHYNKNKNLYKTKLIHFSIQILSTLYHINHFLLLLKKKMHLNNLYQTHPLISYASSFPVVFQRTQSATIKVLLLEITFILGCNFCS
jgi:hypothetical protein